MEQTTTKEKIKFGISYNPKWAGILIAAPCIVGVGINIYVNQFRITDYRWIYEYGKKISILMGLGSIGWSFFHPIIVWFLYQNNWKKHLGWILVGLMPIMYFLIMMIWIGIRFDSKITPTS